MKERIGRLARHRGWSMALAAVVLAFAGIVVLRTRTSAAEPIAPPPRLDRASATRLEVSTPELRGVFALTQGAVLAGGTREAFGELRLEALAQEGRTERRPVSLAIVLDTSGSMYGDKIDQARDSIRRLVERMHPEDRVAIVVYSHDARTLQALAPVSDVRARLDSLLREIEAMGGTNIPAGLDEGVRALAPTPGGMSQRLVLVSDGLDGSGQSLGRVQGTVRDRATAGATVSALGVGIDYDERWLTGVADAGRGNYAFLSDGVQLASFLTRELEQAATTVAESTTIRLRLPGGWRVANVYGATQTQDGNDVLVPFGALFAGERRRATLRLEVLAPEAGDLGAMQVALRYRAARGGQERLLEPGALALRAVTDEALVTASRDVTLHAEAVAQHLDARQAEAVDLWRQGDVDGAQRITRGNVAQMRQMEAEAPQAAPRLRRRSAAFERDLGKFSSVAPASAEGRAYGLGANSERRQQMGAF